MEDTYTFNDYHDEELEKLEKRLGIKVEPCGLKIEGIDTNTNTSTNNTNEEESTMATETLREKMEKAAKAQKSNNPCRIFKHWDEVDHHQHKKAVITTTAVGVGVAAAVTTTCILVHKHHENESYGGCNGSSGEFNSAF